VKYIADLHIHSCYSRATSKLSNLQGLAAWAAVKGIHVIGTGDFTHPEWFSQITEQLTEAEPGFYKLKPEFQQIDGLLPGELKPPVAMGDIRFALTAEISSIYKKHDRVRKNHNVLFAPDIASVQRINQALGNIGNLKADGRPILGLDARNLLEILLEKAPEGFFIPAHIWTPWFSLFGSKSGFDKIEDCFEDLTPHIFALETGLSSDPDMNRRVSALDAYTFISNSDCHSPAKLGREANIFSTEFDFFHLREAIKHPVDNSGKQVFSATIEFYPEEGKYHCDGHRKCNICFEPEETIKHEGKCPECGRPLTVGVLHRVMALADRDAPQYNDHDPAFFSCTPLPEILSELLGVGPATKKVTAAYAKVISLLGSEFDILLNVPIDEISRKSSPLIGEAVRRVRNNEVIRKPGFDGEFGVIRVFDEGERAQLAGQLSMFAPLKKKKSVRKTTSQVVQKKQSTKKKDTNSKARILNPEQEAALNDQSRIIVVKAGPGTGKTHTLVQRVVKILKEEELNCTVISFTNKAVDEVRERITANAAKTGKERELQSRLQVFTFHGYCLHWLKKQNPQINPIGPSQRNRIVHYLSPDIPQSLRQEVLEDIGNQRNSSYTQQYLSYTKEHNLIDLDYVLSAGLELLLQNTDLAHQMQVSTGYLFVDEFQDVNQVQYELVRHIARQNPVFVIGDPDQAIYSFRGADARWFDRFSHTAHASSHQLIQNYRSGAVIVEAALGVIGHNPKRDSGAALEPSGAAAGCVHLQQCSTPIQEARTLVQIIEALIGGTSHREVDKISGAGETAYTLKDIGILFRTSQQMKIVSRVLGEHGIPFQLVDLKAFYTRGDLKIIYLTLLMLAGLADEEEELTVLSGQKGVGSKVLQSLRSALMERDGGIRSILELEPGVFAAKDVRGALDAVHYFFTRLKERLKDGISTRQVIDILTDHYNFSSELPELRWLHTMSVNYADDPVGFAHYLKRYSDSIIYDEQAECVTLSTMHAAKGLEYKVVLIAGAENGLCPLEPRSPLDGAELTGHIEEERRLFYVAMTRAIEKLFLLHCQSRTVHGKKVGSREPSLFIQEIPSHCFSPFSINQGNQRRKKPAKKQLSLF